ncbi:pyridoxal phosphate-dependent transferase [Pyronema domesticum]|nr:pyridoxal phosphate-dependent transferase [Pyronema domesticum]
MDPRNILSPQPRSGVPGITMTDDNNEQHSFQELLQSLQNAMVAATAIERSSTPHLRYREAHAAKPVHKHPGLDPSKASTVWTTERAYEAGFLDCPEEWGNLGQGAPEVEDTIPHAFHKPTTLDISVNSREYGPVAGIMPLRKAVADLYNAHYREGKESQYTWENVAIVPGGRAGLIRIAAVLNNAYLSFFIPDYTAYNEMLGLFKNFSALPTLLDEEDGYELHPEKIKEEIKRGVQVILTSNPRNPTGHTVKDEALKELMDVCRGRSTLIMDEFYAGYNYTSDCDGTSVSCARYVEDVNNDDVLIIDGLTKRFRLPGWRIAWVVGPKEFIKAIGSCGSYLDGGSNVPFQEAAIPLLEPNFVRAEMRALQLHFRDKRDYVIRRLSDMGFKFRSIPDSTFYIWLDLSHLPPKIQNGLGFFEECLKEKVIVVPGIFFDLNPQSRRDLFDSPCHHYCRLSYGPKWDTLKKGINGIERVLQKHDALPEGYTGEAEE